MITGGEKESKNMNCRIWSFAFYSICYESIIWGVFGWGVFAKGASAWWFILAVFLSISQLKPKHFGINPCFDRTPVAE